MLFPLRLRLWIEKWLRARRFARADKPSARTPPWIREAESFSLLDSNPMSPIAAGKIGWVERSGAASRLLGTYALELQQAADSLEASRSRLALAEAFAHAPHAPPRRRQELVALSDSSEFGVVERQRRSLSMEREALCLLTAGLRQRYSACLPTREQGGALDLPQARLSGMTLLAYFVSIRRIDVVELLLEAGARPDAPCSDQETALGIASRKADALASACPAASKAAGILSLLESASMDEGVPDAPSGGARRI